MDSELGSQRTILRSIVEDSIQAFPDDAHHKVLQYLLESGLDEAQSLKFRQSWSKVVLGTQAFGRGSKSKIDPSLFSEELIRELSYSDEQITRLINAYASSVKLDTKKDGLKDANEESPINVRNARDTFSSLDAITAMGANLTGVLQSLYATESSSLEETHNSTELLESIGLFRKSLRGTRLQWGGSVLPADVVYLPLDSVIHGLPDLTKGRVDLQLRTDRQDLNAYMSTDEVIGVVISNKQCVHQERGWNAYLSLNELLSSKGLHLFLFPLPVGVHREPANLSTAFAFESAAGCVPFTSVLGPALSTYLRRTTHVVHRWCAQLAQARRSLLACSGSLMKPIRVGSDVFVRENGNLLVGNVAFDATPPGNRPGYALAFLRVCCELLQRALCLSRAEAVQLGSDGYWTITGTGGMEHEGEGEDEEGVRGGRREGGGGGGGSVAFSEPDDVVLAVVVGSTLDLIVTGHSCDSMLLVDGRAAMQQEAVGAASSSRLGTYGRHSAGAGPSAGVKADEHASTVGFEKLSPSTLLVNAAASSGTYADYAHIQAIPSAPGKSHCTDEKSLGITLHTLKPGVMSLHLSARVLADDGSPAREDGAGARYRRRGCRVKVVIVPNYPVESVLLQELLGHLEEARKWRNPEILLHAQLFQRPQRSEVEEEEKAAATAVNSASPAADKTEAAAAARARRAVVVNARDVQRGWQDIKRVITNHGTLHTPK